MGNLYDMIENTGTVSPSQPLGVVKVPATGILELPKSPPQGPFPAAGIMTSSLSPIMSNKEYMEFLRDYYSTPPEQLMSLRQGMVPAAGNVQVKHYCTQCQHVWKSFDIQPKRCSRCFSYKWNK